jgi:hypothetical protein
MPPPLRGRATPTTPAAELAKLMLDHGDVVLENPALPLVLATHPDFWALVHPMERALIAGHPRCPVSLVTWTLQNLPPGSDWVFRGFAANAALPESLRRASFDQCSDSRSWKGKPEDFVGCLSAEERAVLERAGLWAPRTAALSEAEFKQLAVLGRVGRQLAIGQLDCPTAVLDGLFEESWPNPVPELVAHPNLSTHRIGQALSSPKRELHRAAASNPSLTEAQFARLMKEKAVYDALEQNPSLPVALRVLLEGAKRKR